MSLYLNSVLDLLSVRKWLYWLGLLNIVGAGSLSCQSATRCSLSHLVRLHHGLPYNLVLMAPCTFIQHAMLCHTTPVLMAPCTYTQNVIPCPTTPVLMAPCTYTQNGMPSPTTALLMAPYTFTQNVMPCLTTPLLVRSLTMSCPTFSRLMAPSWKLEMPILRVHDFFTTTVWGNHSPVACKTVMPRSR